MVLSDRDDRRAAALRANLQRRKAQARRRADGTGVASPSEADDGANHAAADPTTIGRVARPQDGWCGLDAADDK